MVERASALRTDARRVSSGCIRDRLITRGHWVCLLLIVAATVALRVRLLDIPLERDEGEYAYIGQLMLEGVPPYEGAYTMKMPGVHASYALIMAVFGRTHRGIHAGLLVINALTIILLYLLARRLFGVVAGLVAALAYALLSISSPIQGFSANTEHFVNLFALAGVVVLLYVRDRAGLLRLLAGGFLLGIAFLMKQHALFFILFGGVFLLACELRPRPVRPARLAGRLGVFAAGVFLPFLLTCLALWAAGAFDKFWFWTFSYARQYVSALPLSVGSRALTTGLSIIARAQPLLWLLAGVGFFGLFTLRIPAWRKAFVVGFFVASFLAVCPGLYFRPHYFLFMMPAVALFAGLGALAVVRLAGRLGSPALAVAIPAIFVCIVAGHAVYIQRAYLFTLEPGTILRRTYGGCPFEESLPIADAIREHTDPNEPIAMLGSEPQILFYADRRSASPYIYMYPLMEEHAFAAEMQRELIRDIEQTRPRILLYVDMESSWVPWPDSDTSIFDWVERYTSEHYEKIGAVDIVSWDYSAYRWGPAAREYTPRSDRVLYVYLRKDQP